MNKKEVYICVDAGGTTSKAAIFSKDGIILARGFSESGSPAVNYDRWYLNIEKSIIDAINHYPNPIKIIKMVFGVSGISALSSIEDVKHYFEQKYFSTCIITSDTITALYSVLENSKDAGMVVIAGTGVAIFGKNHNETMLIGGWGHLLREKGSAYAIVHDFCVKIIDKYEEGIQFDDLEYAFLNNYKIANVRELNHLFYQHSKDEIAKLSIFFKQQAKLGNKQAIKLLKNEGFELAKQTINLMKKLDLKNNTIIGLTGGFIDNDGKYIIEGFKEYMYNIKIKLRYKINYGEQLFGVYKFAITS
mgnify:CR=1 FL=1